MSHLRLTLPQVIRDPRQGDDSPTRNTRVARRLGAAIAPVAADAGAPIRDPHLLDIAAAVADAFTQGDASRGLTKAQIVDRIGPGVDTAEVERRLEVFERLGWLRPYLDKKHQQRYGLDPAGVLGQQVFERICSRGGVDELLALLSRTRTVIAERGSHADVAANLANLRDLLAVYANELDRLVATAPWHELITERDDHDRATVFTMLGSLVEEVAEHHPDLRALATRVIEEANRYVRAVEGLMTRVLDEGARSQDFRVLPADDYLTAAIDCGVDELAAAFTDVVFDPPSPWTTAADILDNAGPRGSRSRPTRRPVAPPASGDDDPLNGLLTAAEQAGQRRALRAEQLLDGNPEVEATSTVRALRWPAAATLLGDLLALDLDPRQPYLVEIGEAILVDTETEVTYSSPVTLHVARGEPLVDDEPANTCTR